MFAGLLGTYIAAAASIVSAVPYEDDPRYFRLHKASTIAEVSEQLFVKIQSQESIWGPRSICMAIKRAPRNESEASLTTDYILAYGNFANDTQTLNTTLTTTTTPPHVMPNAFAYRTATGGLISLLKVMYADGDNDCFILVTSSSSNGRGCTLLQTNRTVDEEIPPDCERVYRRNCPRSSAQVYRQYCREVLTGYLS